MRILKEIISWSGGLGAEPPVLFGFIVEFAVGGEFEEVGFF